LPTSASAAVSAFTVLARRTNESAESASPNSSPRAAGTRPAAIGRFSVRLPISRSMSRSSTWFRALAPPQASARPTSAAAKVSSGGTPPAPTNVPAAPVTRRSDMIRGFVSVT
jgi:hypothetical protein